MEECECENCNKVFNVLLKDCSVEMVVRHKYTDPTPMHITKCPVCGKKVLVSVVEASPEIQNA